MRWVSLLQNEMTRLLHFGRLLQNVSQQENIHNIHTGYSFNISAPKIHQKSLIASSRGDITIAPFPVDGESILNTNGLFPTTFMFSKCRGVRTPPPLIVSSSSATIHCRPIAAV